MKTLSKFFQVFALLALLVGCTAKKENVVRVNLGAEPNDARSAKSPGSSIDDAGADVF